MCEVAAQTLAYKAGSPGSTVLRFCHRVMSLIALAKSQNRVQNHRTVSEAPLTHGIAPVLAIGVRVGEGRSPLTSPLETGQGAFRQTCGAHAHRAQAGAAWALAEGSLKKCGASPGRRPQNAPPAGAGRAGPVS